MYVQNIPSTKVLLCSWKNSKTLLRESSLFTNESHPGWRGRGAPKVQEGVAKVGWCHRALALTFTRGEARAGVQGNREQTGTQQSLSRLRAGSIVGGMVSRLRDISWLEPGIPVYERQPRRIVANPVIRGKRFHYDLFSFVVINLASLANNPFNTSIEVSRYTRTIHRRFSRSTLRSTWPRFRLKS